MEHRALDRRIDRTLLATSVAPSNWMLWPKVDESVVLRPPGALPFVGINGGKYPCQVPGQKSRA
jgi:hypothetical protein